METGRRTGECDRRGRREAVELEHLDLVVHPRPRNLRPFALLGVVVRDRRESRCSCVLTFPQILGRWTQLSGDALRVPYCCMRSSDLDQGPFFSFGLVLLARAFHHDYMCALILQAVCTVGGRNPSREMSEESPKETTRSNENQEKKGI